MLHSSWHSGCERCQLCFSLSPAFGDAQMSPLSVNTSLTFTLILGSSTLPAGHAPHHQPDSFAEICGLRPLGGVVISVTLQGLALLRVILKDFFLNLSLPDSWEHYSLAAPGG